MSAHGQTPASRSVPGSSVSDSPAQGIAPSGRAAVTVNGVTQRFQLPDREFVALRDITVTVQEGEFVSIIGPSGCGKSTLLRLIAGLIEPSAGEIRIGDETPAQARARSEIGFVFQEPTLLPWRTALDNVTLLTKVARRGTAAERRRRGMELLELVGLADFADAHPAKLSGGMQRRVGIARALALDPQILLMDEPFGALDELTRQQMNLELLRIWADQRTTAVLVTHNVGEAVFLSDRVLVMGTRPGTMIEEVVIDLPRPRRLELLQDEVYFALSSHLIGVLLGDGQSTDA